MFYGTISPHLIPDQTNQYRVDLLYLFHSHCFRRESPLLLLPWVTTRVTTATPPSLRRGLTLVIKWPLVCKGKQKMWLPIHLPDRAGENTEEEIVYPHLYDLYYSQMGNHCLYRQTERARESERETGWASNRLCVLCVVCVMCVYVCLCVFIWVSVFMCVMFVMWDYIIQ